MTDIPLNKQQSDFENRQPKVVSHQSMVELVEIDITGDGDVDSHGAMLATGQVEERWDGISFRLGMSHLSCVTYMSPL